MTAHGGDAGRATEDEPALFSCLCVTEGRAPFMPWLLWGFRRQTWPHKELVIVDSSQTSEAARAPWAHALTGEPIRIVAAPPGTNVPAKRNLALQAARGRYLAWFDDDDWQHPARLACLAGALAAGAHVAGSCHSFFVDLFALGSYHYAGRGHLIFNAAGFLTETARAARFDERVAKASDRAWMDAVLGASTGRVHTLGDALHTFWLCHDANLSNPRGRLPLCFPLDLVKRRIGPAAWGDTEEQLQALRSRVQAQPTPSLKNSPSPRRSRGEGRCEGLPASPAGTLPRPAARGSG